MSTWTTSLHAESTLRHRGVGTPRLQDSKVCLMIVELLESPVRRYGDADQMLWILIDLPELLWGSESQEGGCGCG